MVRVQLRQGQQDEEEETYIWDVTEIELTALNDQEGMKEESRCPIGFCLSATTSWDMEAMQKVSFK